MRIFRWCVLFWKKYSRLGVAPEPLAIWIKELEGLVLKLLWFFVKGFLSIYTGSLSKKNSDIARSGFFLSWDLGVVCLEEVFLVTCAFLKKKAHSLSVAPEPLAIWNKKLKGLDPLCLFENLCSEVIPEIWIFVLIRVVFVVSFRSGSLVLD